MQDFTITRIEDDGFPLVNKQGIPCGLVTLYYVDNSTFQCKLSIIETADIKLECDFMNSDEHAILCSHYNVPVTSKKRMKKCIYTMNKKKKIK